MNKTEKPKPDLVAERQRIMSEPVMGPAALKLAEMSIAHGETKEQVTAEELTAGMTQLMITGIRDAVLRLAGEVANLQSDP